MDELKISIAEALKSLNRPTPFYVTNAELTPVIMKLHKKYEINGLAIGEITIGRALKQMGYKRQKSKGNRGWIIDKI